jgi:hypothetical protein
MMRFERYPLRIWFPISKSRRKRRKRIRRYGEIFGGQ